MKRFLFGIFAFMLAVGPTFAAVAPPTPPPVSVLSGQVSLSVSGVSSRVQLPSTADSAIAVTVVNTGLVDAYIATGTVAIVATSGGTCAAGSAGPSCRIPAGTSISFYTSDAYIAAITASSTTTLIIYQATGPLSLRSTGGSGSSGTVNSGTTPDVAYYATSGSAVSDGGTATVTVGGLNVTGSTVPANGIYLGGTNQINWTTNSIARMQLSTGGPVVTNNSSNGLTLCNTTDCTTNFEKAQLYWNSNAATLDVAKGGTGTVRALVLEANGGATNAITINPNPGTPAGIQITTGNAGVGSVGASFGGSFTASSGTQTVTSIAPIFNQTSTAGAVALLVQPTATAVGSGGLTLASFGTAALPGIMTINAAQNGSCRLCLTDSGAITGSISALINGTWSNSSAIDQGLRIAPTINQSVTAGYTALAVYPTESATGSGAKLLIDAGVGASSKFSVDDVGAGTFANTLIVGSDLTLQGSTAKLRLANGNAIFFSPSAATFQLGNTDVASPVAQTLGVQNVVAGTTNTAGAITTIRNSAGTGTGLGGNIVFQYAPHGSTGTTQNAFATAMTINGDTANVTMVGPTLTLNTATIANSSVAGSSTSVLITGGYLGLSGDFALMNSTTRRFWISQNGGDKLSMVSAGRIGFTSSATDGAGTFDTAISRIAAGVMGAGNGTAADLSGQFYGATVRTGQTTVAGLPAAGTAGAGARGYVTDATVCTFGTTVIGGSTLACPVYSDGTNWKEGSTAFDHRPSNDNQQRKFG